MNIVKAETVTEFDGSVYYSVTTTDERVHSVPTDPNNSDYAELMRQVAEEGLVIEEAE